MKTCWQFIQAALVVFIFSGLIIGLAYMLWIGGALGPYKTSDPLDVYQREYQRCMAREVIGHDECHNIAVHAAYPEKSNGNTLYTYPYNYGQ